jgi:hypothetical protein
MSMVAYRRWLAILHMVGITVSVVGSSFACVAFKDVVDSVKHFDIINFDFETDSESIDPVQNPEFLYG